MNDQHICMETCPGCLCNTCRHDSCGCCTEHSFIGCLAVFDPNEINDVYYVPSNERCKGYERESE